MGDAVQRGRSRRWVFAAGAVALLLMAAAVVALHGNDARRGGVLGESADFLPCEGQRVTRTLSARSGPPPAPGPLRERIPPDAAVDPRSSQMVAALASVQRQKGFVVSMKSWTVPVYTASAKTPRYDVRLTAPWAPPGAVLRNVPIPRRARPDPRDDGHLAILDPRTGCEYDFWQARKAPDGRWTASWGRKLPLYGPGVDPHGTSARATGFALTAGLIFPRELDAGVIRHALVFSFPYTRKGPPVPPATSSDGWSTDAFAIPQGARLQLDPSLDLDSLKLTKAERAVARALQVYGMYLGDTGGAVGVYAAHPHSYERTPYRRLRPIPEYLLLRIPLERMRVLALPDLREPTGPAVLGLGPRRDGRTRLDIGPQRPPAPAREIATE